MKTKQLPAIYFNEGLYFSFDSSPLGSYPRFSPFSVEGSSGLGKPDINANALYSVSGTPGGSIPTSYALHSSPSTLKEMLKAREQGMVHHICHSFHGSLESLKKCVDTGLFESVTLQYNLLDQSLEEGIAYAAGRGMGITVMGPVGGGRLGYPSGKAQEIAGAEENTWKAAEKICKWVYESIKDKNYKVGFGTAKQTLKDLQGDCSEHTVLFVGLARSLGIPARICTGLVYHRDAFYYHFWPEVYVGRWISMEPTLGQTQADATHLKFISSPVETESALELGEGVLKTMNRLRIKRLDD